MRKNLIKTVAFLLIGALLFAGFWHVFRLKNEKNLERMKRLPRDTVDVMFIGSSHAFMNIDPSVLYRESGVSGFVLGCGSQPIWQTYYHLKEALKTQSPKVVFVECYKLDMQQNYSKAAVTVKATIGMSLSRDYMDMLNASLKRKAKKINFILQFPWFHSRYNELTMADILPDYGNPYYKDHLGYFLMTQVVQAKFPTDVDQVTERKPLSRKNRRYLDKIVALSEEKGFDLVFLITPFWQKAKQKQPYYNTLADYAAERDIPLLNCNLTYDQIGLDETVDFSRTSHLSVTGAEKLTMYLNDYIAGRWALADHRGDERYAVWDRNLALMEIVRQDPEKWTII